MAKKRQRQTKVSKGIHGGGGKMDRPLSEVEKVLLGGGLFRSMRPIGSRRPRPTEEAAE